MRMIFENPHDYCLLFKLHEGKNAPAMNTKEDVANNLKVDVLLASRLSTYTVAISAILLA